MALWVGRCRRRRLFLLAILLCLLLPAAGRAVHLSDSLQGSSFSVLILGDSQMAGAGWEGGYANCILEAYPHAQVVNLARNGSLLANGDIHAQWEFYRSEAFPRADFVLLDGGVNDLPHIQKEEFADTGLALVQDAFCSLVEQIHQANPETRILYILMPPLAEWKDSDKGPPAYEVQERYWKQMNITANSYDYVTVLDLFSLNPFHFPCAECYHEYLADSIHLSETGYRKTFEYIENAFAVHLANQQAE